jgi:erythromycin esterase
MRPATLFGQLSLVLLAVTGTACLDESLIKQPELTIVPGLPAGWGGTTSTAAIGTTVTEHRSGATSVYLSNAFNQGLGSFTLTQSIRADAYRGKRVELTAWVRPRNITSVVTSGIWMRVDGAGTMLGFDNMSRRPVSGYGDWRQVRVVLDVPTAAIGISFGALFQGTNTLLVDDMQFTVVDSTVARTNMLAGVTAGTMDSATTIAFYARRATEPVNLDFEGLESLAGNTATWITQNSSTLTSTDPSAALDDLEPLRSFVGTAHVVGLGEATHGTKEFQLVKHRLLKFLVTRMGFTTFAIEATSPEADDLNEYVLNGTGDPVRLLSRLYFWTWNTQELLDMIRWMRTWNTTAPANQRVSFRGFDIQYPSASMDSVLSFIHRVKPTLDADVSTRYECLRAYRNNGAITGAARTQYLVQSAELRQICAEGLAFVKELVRTQATSAPGYQATLHHARLVEQFEGLLATASSAILSNARRDDAMAENIAWLRDQMPTDGRMVVWAHNEHITRLPGAMGASLNTRYASDYVPIALDVGRGQFNAVELINGIAQQVRSFDVQTVRTRSLEEAFVATNIPLLFLDIRKTVGGAPASQALRGPIDMRNVGSSYEAAYDLNFYATRLFPTDFDGVLFVSTGTPTTRLPFVN